MRGGRGSRPITARRAIYVSRRPLTSLHRSASLSRDHPSPRLMSRAVPKVCQLESESPAFDPVSQAAAVKDDVKIMVSTI